MTYSVCFVLYGFDILLKFLINFSDIKRINFKVALKMKLFVCMFVSSGIKIEWENAS